MWYLNCPDGNRSIALNFDFVRDERALSGVPASAARFFSWHGVTLRIIGLSVPAQESRLGYQILG